MFASQTTSTVSLANGVSVTIRRLSWLQRRDAQKVSQQQSMKDLAAMGGPSVLKSIMDDATGDGEKVALSPLEQALATHDWLTVLVCGITSWTADRPVSKDALSDLDDDEAETLVRAILAASLPSSPREGDSKNVG